MSLKREDLESGLFRRLWQQCADGPRPLSDEELDASLASALAGTCADEDVWVFAYGSLLWNPLFHFEERRPATIRGFHRSFCLWSKMGRGTPDKPGLVLGLDRGGSCCGLAYRLPAGKAAAELKVLWQREMVVGSYEPRWLRVEAAPCEVSHGCAEELRALTFVVRPEHPFYAGRLPLETVAGALASANGHIGSSADYLFHTVDALAAHGLRDGYLDRLSERVARERGES